MGVIVLFCSWRLEWWKGGGKLVVGFDCINDVNWVSGRF